MTIILQFNRKLIFKIIKLEKPLSKTILFKDVHEIAEKMAYHNKKNAPNLPKKLSFIVKSKSLRYY